MKELYHHQTKHPQHSEIYLTIIFIIIPIPVVDIRRMPAVDIGETEFGGNLVEEGLLCPQLGSM